MAIKRFVAPTMRRALDLVRLEMGPDAIILSSQKTKGGIEIITSTELDEATRGGEAGKTFSKRFDTELDTPLNSDLAWQSQKGINEAAKQFKVSSVDDDAYRSERLAKEIELARERMIAAKRGQALQNTVSDIDPLEHAEHPSGVEAIKKADTTSSVAQFNVTPKLDEKPQQQPNNLNQGVVLSESYQDYEAYAQTVEREANNDGIKRSVASSVDRQMAGLQEQVSHLAEKENMTYIASEDQHLSSLKDEIADMRMLLEQQMLNMRNGGRESQVHTMFPSPNTEVLQGHLGGLGLPDSIVKKLIASVRPGQRLNSSWREALAILSKQIKTDSSDKINGGGVFALVGPTGVGKTTTIGKLAARYVLEHGLGKVALITTDTYRVGAHDQLKSLGRILNVPVRVVDQERSLASVVASLKAFPLILIDTAGFRQGDPLLSQQEAMLATCPSLNRILVLSCNAQVQTLKASAHAFSKSKLEGCILTKLDESGSLGELLGVLIQHSLSVMYTTDGQAIPNDLDKASAPNLIAKAVALMTGKEQIGKVAVGHP